MKTLTKHYIDGAFVESHGREVMDIIRPTDSQVIGRVTLGDEEDTRRAIAAAKAAFATFGRTSKEERSKFLRRLSVSPLAMSLPWIAPRRASQATSTGATYSGMR